MSKLTCSFSRMNFVVMVTIISVMFLMIGVLGIPTPAHANDNKIVYVGRAQWNYDIINANVLTYALEAKGYKVKIKDIFDMGIMFAAVEDGSIDIYADAWLPDTHSSYVERTSNILTGGNLWGSECPYVWTVPCFVTEKYGVKSIEDLKGKGDIFDGKITGIEEGTGGTQMSLEGLKTYKLSGEYKYISSSVAAMIGEIKAAVKMKEPIIGILWRPHPIFDQLCLNMLEDPKGVFAFDTVQYAINKDFAKTHPEIVSFMNEFRIPRSDIEGMMKKNETDGIPEKKLSLDWYNAHKQEIKSWWK